MKILKNKVLVIILIVAIILIVPMNYSIATTGKILAESARVRKEASSNSEVISVATKGEKVDVIGEENGWYKVKFEDVTGYIRSDLVDTEYTNSSSNSNLADTSINEDNNVSSYDNSLENDTVSSADDSTVNSDISDENSNNQNLENTIIEFTVGSVFTIEREVNVRRLPSFSSRNISVLESGTELTVLDKLNHWIKITNNNITGWIVVESVNSSNVQSSTIDNSEINASMESNNTTNNSEGNSSDYIKVESNSSNTSSINKTGYINVDSARIRQKPNGTVIDVVDLNDKVEILEEDEEWYKINVKEYKECYISKKLVTVSK